MVLSHYAACGADLHVDHALKFMSAPLMPMPVVHRALIGALLRAVPGVSWAATGAPL
jgi:hypothetical protein